MKRLCGTVGLVAVLAACASESGEDSGPPMTREEAITVGKELYARYGCAACHGADGRGDGPVAKHLNPRPRDFREPEAFKKGRSLGAIAETIRVGVMFRGAGMPGYPHLPERERRAMAAYVASLMDEAEAP